MADHLLTTRMGRFYPRMLGERFGMAAGVEAVLAVAGEPEPDLPAAAEELARDVTLLGTYDEAAGAVAAWFEAGADVVTSCCRLGGRRASCSSCRRGVRGLRRR